MYSVARTKGRKMCVCTFKASYVIMLRKPGSFKNEKEVRSNRVRIVCDFGLSHRHGISDGLCGQSLFYLPHEYEKHFVLPL